MNTHEHCQLCDPVDCSPSASSVLGDSPGKNTGVGCHALLHGIFLTQGMNPGLPHHRQILYCLSHQGICMSISCLKSIFAGFEPWVGKFP